MGSTSITPQWSLDQTANDIIGVSRSLIEAATSDNVQALALLASEGLGATVAMSPESCHKVYLLCNKGHESTVLHFIKSSIGWRKGDCGRHLVQSDAGLRFLGIAAMLTTIETWTAAGILYDLIRRSAADKRLLPARYQLKQLMIALEDRLAASGFSDMVLGWVHVFMDGLQTSKDADALAHSMPREPHDVVPSAKTIVSLVEAISSVARVGETTQRVEITASANQAAWITALVKWCLGAPPIIVLYNQSSIRDDEGSTGWVILRVTKQDADTPQAPIINVFDNIGNITNLVGSPPPGNFIHGLVSIGVFGKAKMRQFFGDERGVRYRACLEALPSACGFVWKKIHMQTVAGHGARTRTETLRDVQQRLGPETTITPGRALASLHDMSQTLRKYLSVDDENLFNIVEPSVTDSVLLEDLPLWQIVKARTMLDCPCGSCPGTPSNLPNCQYGRLANDFTTVVAHIILLSLFNTIDPAGVQVYYGSNVYRELDGRIGQLLFPSVVHSIVSFDYLEMKVEDLMLAAIHLLGHGLDNTFPSYGWIASSRFGQTIYPAQLARIVVHPDDIVTLECVPGSIIQGNDRYESVVFSFNDHQFPHISPRNIDDEHTYKDLREPAVPINPRDAFGGYDLEWVVSPGESILYVAVTCSRFPMVPHINPLKVMEAAVNSFFVNCTHDKTATFLPKGVNIIETTPVNALPKQKDQIAVVQVDRNDQMRFFSLGYGQGVIIRQNACLECCVNCAIVAPTSVVLS